jgi:hypothetical protein
MSSSRPPQPPLLALAAADLRDDPKVALRSLQ